MIKPVTLIFTLFIFSSCLKTSEELRREKIVDTMSVQMKESQAMMAELNTRLQEFQERATSFQGQVEELEHRQKELTTSQSKKINENLESLNAQIASLQRTVDNNEKTIRELGSEIHSQKKFVSKVTKSLSGMSNSPIDQYNEAMKLMDQKKYQQALPLLEDLVSSNINAGKKNAVYYNLGLIKYDKKDYEQCLIYMSKIFTKWPRSSYAPKSLLYIARSFREQGKKDEAKASYNTLIKDYSKTSQAKAGSSEIKKL